MSYGASHTGWNHAASRSIKKDLKRNFAGELQDPSDLLVHLRKLSDQLLSTIRLPISSIEHETRAGGLRVVAPVQYANREFCTASTLKITTFKIELAFIREGGQF
jgi:hypothetical protein